MIVGVPRNSRGVGRQFFLKRLATSVATTSTLPLGIDMQEKPEVILAHTGVAVPIAGTWPVFDVLRPFVD